jgi:hypothetical protein
MDHEAQQESHLAAPVAAPAAMPVAAPVPSLSAAASGMGNAAFGTVAAPATPLGSRPAPQLARSPAPPSDRAIEGALARTVVARRPAAPRTVARDYLEDAGQREVENRRMATATSSVMQVTNVDDVASARKLMARLEADEPNLHTALTQSTTNVMPGMPDQRGRLQGEITSNQAVMSDLRTYLASAGVQTLAISQYQVMLRQTFEDFDRLEGKMAVLTGSKLSGPEKPSPVRVGSTSVNGGAGTGETQSSTAVSDINDIGGLDMTKEIEDLKKTDPKIAAAMEKAEGPNGAKARMKTAAGRLRTVQSGALTTSTDVSAQARLLSGALAALQASEVRAKYAKNKAESDKVSGYVSDVMDIAAQVAVAYATGGTAAGAGGSLGAGLPAAGAAAKGAIKEKGLAKIKEDLKQRFDNFLEAANKAAGDFPDHSNLVADKLDEKARIETAKGAAAQLNSTKAKLQPAIEAFNTEIGALEQAKQDYDDAMKEVGTLLDAAALKQGKGGKNKSRFSQSISLIREGEQFLLQAGETHAMGEKELGAKETSRSKVAAADLRKAQDGTGQSGRLYYEPFSVKKTKVDWGGDGKPPKEVDDKREVDDPDVPGKKKEETIVFWDTRAVRVKIDTALSPTVFLDDGPNQATGAGSAETHRDANGDPTNKGANDVIVKSLEQVGQMKDRTQRYVQTLRTMTIGGIAGPDA